MVVGKMEGHGLQHTGRGLSFGTKDGEMPLSDTETIGVYS